MPTFTPQQSRPQKQAPTSLTTAHRKTINARHQQANPLSSLQRETGDQATQRRPHAQAAEFEPALAASIFPRIEHDFSRIPPHHPAAQTTLAKSAINQTCDACAASPLQRKPTISSPGDRYEREADDVAEKVLRMAEPTPINPAAAAIQRKCAKCKDEEEEKIQTKRAPSSDAGAALDAGAAMRVAGHGGVPLSREVRSYFEPRFGHDFSRVRVHADGAAADGARAVQARAYTIGRDIVFGQGAYAPETLEGKRLLAHELVHVVQQGAGTTALTPKDTPAARQQETKNASEEAAGSVPTSHVARQGTGAASPEGVTVSRSPDRLMRRDDPPQTAGKGVADAAASAAAKAKEALGAAALAELGEIESNWKEMRGPAAGISEAADWLNKGDTVIGLLRTHTEIAIEAISKNDVALSKFMQTIVESDMVMYRYIAWQVAVYVNLLTLEPQMKGLADTFANDKRAFTGRAAAEEHVKLLRQLAAAYRQQAPKRLELVKTLPAGFTALDGTRIELTVTIAAHPDKSVSALFVDETDKLIKDNVSITTLVGATNMFLDNAFDEGMVQAVEAVAEYYSLRGGGRTGPKGSKRAPQSKRQKKKGEKKGTKKKGDCHKHMVACMLTSLASQPGSVFGQSRCLFCAEVCRRDGGIWPQSAPTTTGSVPCDYWNYPGTE